MNAAARTVDVVVPGLLTTVQDLGREGHGDLAISPSGAADHLALRIGNRLVGNLDGAPALEMTLLGGSFRFSHSTGCALAGSDFALLLDGQPCLPWQSFIAKAGQTLSLGPTRSGSRCYLCVDGGIAVAPFLGSASTHLLSGLGGYFGRALRKGDKLELGPETKTSRSAIPRRRANPELLRLLGPRKRLRATLAPQSNWFSPTVLDSFFSTTFSVTEACDRQGLRLQAQAFSCPPGREMITEGVSLGAVQVPPDGQPIVVFVEQQTTGGYPVIANVISADVSSLGQLRPRDEVRFERVDFESAREALLEQENLLASPDLIVES